MKLKEPLIYKNLESRFEKYLQDEDNNQILFSGPFGSGKTTFLKSFFSSKENYNVFRIFPVNYVLHENSDIFEILKYDIIMELIEKKAFDVPDIDKLTKYIFSVSQSLDDAVGKIISLFSNTGKSVVDVAEVMEKSLAKSLGDYKKIDDPLLSVRQFLNTIESYKKYSHNDYITSVIQEKLDELSENREKQNILIVDDMDRIDPEHLFRIISIFSSHIDMDTDCNKFGFNKIIFVGDNENFRSMFFYKYGIINNYNAYISKLCSKSPFNFDPDRELYGKIVTIVDGIQFKYANANSLLSTYQNKTDNVKRYYTYIFCSLINSGALSLRELVKFQGVHENLEIRADYISDLRDYIDQFKLFNLVVLLNTIIPGGLITALQKLLDNPLSINRIFTENGASKARLSELSTIPLEFYFADENQSVETTLTYKFSGLNLSITFFKQDRVDRIQKKINEPDATEYNLILVTIEAIKKMQLYF